VRFTTVCDSDDMTTLRRRRRRLDDDATTTVTPSDATWMTKTGRRVDDDDRTATATASTKLGRRTTDGQTDEGALRADSRRSGRPRRVSIAAPGCVSCGNQSSEHTAEASSRLGSEQACWRLKYTVQQRRRRFTTGRTNSS